MLARGPQYCLLAAQGRFRTGGSLAAATPDSCDGLVADRDSVFRFFNRSAASAGPVGRLRGVEPCGPGLAGRAVEGRAVAGRLQPREAARRRTVADRARRQRRRQIARAASAGRLISGSPKSRRRPRGTGGDAARDGASADCGNVTREIAVRADQPPRPQAHGRKRLAGAQYLESRERRTCSRRGSRSCSTRRSTRRRHGRRCMRCCATNRATSCSTIWVSAKTR